MPSLHDLMAAQAAAARLEFFGERDGAGRPLSVVFRFAGGESRPPFAITEAKRTTQVETRGGVVLSETMAIQVPTAGLGVHIPVPPSVPVLVGDDPNPWTVTDDLDSEYGAVWSTLRLARQLLLRQSALIAPDA